MTGIGKGKHRDVQTVADRLAAAVTPGCSEIDAYLSAQVRDESHREVVGPLLEPSGASGVVLHRGERVATWGDPARPEMLFSATKTFVSLVAGAAFDAGRLDPARRVVDDVPLEQLLSAPWAGVTWEQLLQQTSSWDGELWGKPARVDAQSGEEPAAWSYNDVRVNLLCLALTLLWGEPLDTVLAKRIMTPIAGSTTWSWHGYSNSTVRIGDDEVRVVVGGAHWGGGLFMSALDMAAVGAALLDPQAQPVSHTWLRRSWTPSAANPSYGYLWWLNDDRQVFPAAPATGRCARGNLGRHLLWLDPARDLVVASHWTEGIAEAIQEISALVSEASA